MSSDGSVVTVQAAAGEVNRVTVIKDPAGLVVADTGAGLTAGTGCRASSLKVTCGPGPTKVSALLGDGDDTLTVTGGLPVTVDDGAGADIVTGGSGADVFLAAPGTDTYTGGGGVDTLDFSAGAGSVDVDLDARTATTAGEQDTLGDAIESVVGTAFADTLAGDDGANRLAGGAGDDTLDGRGGADLLAGGEGTDTVSYAGRTAGVFVSLDGNANDGESGERDSVPGDVERLRGGSGSDALDASGAPGSVALDGGDGDDRLTGGAFGDIIDGGNGQDRLYGGDGQDTLAGGEDQDQLAGDAGDDVLGGDRGDDDLSGGGGNDHLDGGPGADHLGGGDGDDTLAGGAGDDLLHGDDGVDRLDGDQGDDRENGGSGDDILLAGLDAGADDLAGDDGWDTADYSARAQAIRVSLDDQPADGSPGENDNVRGSIDALVGGSGSDRLSGHDGPNVLAGGAGDDRLDGHGGDDRLLGQAGGDLLVGGDGLDAMFGGDGDDRLSARDQVAERLSCGRGRDVATLGLGDVTTGCERRSDPPPVSAFPGPDVDLPRNPKAIAVTPRLRGPTVPGRRAVVRADGTAAAPAAAPMVVKRMIWTANRLVRLRYVWGGGHSSFSDSGYDCSGSVSYVLHVGGLLDTPLVSGALARYGRPGPGRWVTWYANAGHVFMRVAGLRLDTSPVADPSGRRGPRWRPLDRGSAGFRVRHPANL